MQLRRTSRQGTALVITVGLLAVLAVVGFGFAVLSRLHQEQSTSARTITQIDLLTQAAMQYAIETTRCSTTNARPQANTVLPVLPDRHAFPSGAINSSTDDPSCPWFWYLDGNSNPASPDGFWVPPGCYLDDRTDLPAGDPTNPASYKNSANYRARYCNLKCSSFALVHNVQGDLVSVTNVRVLDSASKININDTYGTTALSNILDTLLNDELGIDKTVLTGTKLIQYRNASRPNGCGGKFASLAELKLAILTKSTVSPAKDTLMSFTERTFEMLKNYLTIYSWPWDPRSEADFSAYTSRPDHLTYDKLFPTLFPLVPPLPPQQPPMYRSPININTASRPVLVAVIANAQADGGTAIGKDKARQIADRIIRRRDPENPILWRNDANRDMTSNWSGTSWLDSSGYKDNIRTRIPDLTYLWPSGKCLGWASYALGPFNTWNEVVDFLYSQDDGSGPFIGGLLNATEVETLLAAISPNPSPSFIPRDTWASGWARLKQDTSVVEQQDASGGTKPLLRHTDDTGLVRPTTLGRTDLDDNTGLSAEFCFSSKGRFEISAKSFTFQKADFGKVTDPTITADASKDPIDPAAADYRLADSTKSWSTSPQQWRGYNVLIYDGKGKGQLRAIVANSTTRLTVAKWSRQLLINDAAGAAPDDKPGNQSRYCIVGPGPLLDRSESVTAVAVTNYKTPTDPAYCCVVSDSNSKGELKWEANQWAGQRIVLYRAQTVNGGGAQGENIEKIDETSIQERYILTNTASTDPKGSTLTVTPALDPNLVDTSASGGPWFLSYMILGSFAAADREAAVKAYDVVYHSTQRDFLDMDPTGKSLDTLPTGSSSVVVGPNPCNLLGAKVPDDNRKLDGWLAIAKTPIAPENNNCPPKGQDFFLLQAFTAGSLEPDKNGKLESGGSPVTVADVFAVPRGCLFPGGLYLRDKSASAPIYSVAVGSTALVTKDRHDGGFVSFWFRPDKDFFSLTGPDERTLILIKGSVDGQEDIRLMSKGNGVGRKLQIVIRNLNDRNYEGDDFLATDPNHPPTKNDAPPVKYQKKTQTWPDPGKPDSTAVIDKWKPGQWHHIAFAWFECANDTETKFNSDNSYNTDGNDKTDWRDDDVDAVTKLPDYKLDEEVISLARLWVDGQSGGASPTDPKGTPKPLMAFNLWPSDPDNPTKHPVLQIGEANVSLAGTIDGLVAMHHADNKLDNATFNIPNDKFSDQYYRYTGYKSDTPTAAVYTSRKIILSNTPTSGNIALGTVSWTGSVPYNDTPTTWGGVDKDKWPISVQVSSDNGATWTDPIPRTDKNAKNHLFLGEGNPIRNAVGAPYLVSGGSILYKVSLLPFYGDKDTTKEWVYPGWQTPVLEDISITYLGPVIYYYSR